MEATGETHVHRTFVRETKRPKKKRKEAIQIAAGGDDVVSGTFYSTEFTHSGVLQKLTITISDYSNSNGGQLIVLVRKTRKGRRELQTLAATKGANLAGDFNIQAGDRLQISYEPMDEVPLIGVWVSGTFMSDERVHE